MVSWGLMCISDMHAPHPHHAATDIWKPGFMDLEDKPEYVIVVCSQFDSNLLQPRNAVSRLLWLLSFSSIK